MIDDFHDSNLVAGQVLQQVLHETISPALSMHGLLWNGKYLWFDQPQQSIRRVVGYMELKGARGTFVWGVCLDFVPTISSGKLRFHRTDKSVTQHLFEWADEYASSFCGGRLDGGVATHWGKQQAASSILRLFETYEQKMYAWFDRASTIEGLIDIAEQQISTGKSYQVHYPEPRFVLAFLQAKANRIEEARGTISRLKLDEGAKALLLNHKFMQG